MAEFDERITEQYSKQLWRLNNLYYILTKDGKEVLFQMNWAQRQLYEKMWYNIIVLKARQIGCSTFFLILALDSCVWNKNFTSGFSAQDLGTIKDLLRRCFKHPYSRLPDKIKAMTSIEINNQFEVIFDNGSRLNSGVSLRGGTYQMVHVSEFGKTAARYPDKATEINTGTFPTVGQGNIKIIESTAEGYDGLFYDYCEIARTKAASGKKLGKMDWRFFFFPWWEHPDYVLHDDSVYVSDTDHEYFDETEEEIGRKITIERRRWYVSYRDNNNMGELMTREFPSTPDEAFKASNEGRYFAKQMLDATEHGRICHVPPDPKLPINTGWDLGVDDYTAIWFHQQDGMRHNIIGYHEGTDEDINHYVNWIRDKYVSRGFVLGLHYMPHDSRNRSLHDKRRLKDIAESLGLRPVIDINAPENLSISLIQDVRNFIGVCWFDEEECETGIKRLKAYSKEWSDRLGGFVDRPRHDENSHGADGFRTLSSGIAVHPPGVIRRSGKKKRRVSGMAA